jgi:hypothetical protein
LEFSTPEIKSFLDARLVARFVLSFNSLNTLKAFGLVACFAEVPPNRIRALNATAEPPPRAQIFVAKIAGKPEENLKKESHT